MDSILKARYDSYRTKGGFPPEAEELLQEHIAPFEDMVLLNKWREDFNALKIIDKKMGYVMVGKIDDVLVEADGRLIPADYKSSGNPPKDDKQKYYKDQLAAYGLMFKKQGYDVSDRAYLLHYFVKDKNDPSLEVTFDSYVDKVVIDASAIEEKIQKMVELLNGDYPGHNPECEKCAYYDGREGVVDGTRQARLI